VGEDKRSGGSSSPAPAPPTSIRPRFEPAKADRSILGLSLDGPGSAVP
jgi:hypothetical protein